MDLWQINAIPADAIGAGSGIAVHIEVDSDHLAWHMAREMVGRIQANNEARRPTCLMLSVSPIAPLLRFAQLVVDQSVDLSDVTIVHMTEFLDGSGSWLPLGHAFSYRAFLMRELYERLPLGNLVRPENRVFPCPDRPQTVSEVIADRGGLDACFAGIGLNGHVGYNEPEGMDADAYARCPTRAVRLAPESRAHLAIALGCSLDLVPERAATVGMAEILGARKIWLYANRPWQAGIVREMLHGPISAGCPASLIRRHPAASMAIARSVAEPRQLRLHSS